MKDSRWTIKAKLLSGYVAIAAITLVVGGLGVYGLMTMETRIRRIGEARMPGLKYLALLNTERMSVRAQTHEVLTTEYADPQHAADTLRRINSQRNATWARLEETLNAFVALPRETEHGKGIVADLQNEFNLWRKHYVELDRIQNDLLTAPDDATRQLLYARYRTVVAEMIPASNQMGQRFDQLTVNNTTNTQLILQRSLALARRLELLALVMSLAGVALAVGLGTLISRSMSRPIVAGVNQLTAMATRNRQLAEAVKVMASGDLSRDIILDAVDGDDAQHASYAARGDEIGQLFRSLLEVRTRMDDLVTGLQTMNKNTSDSLRQVAVASNEVSSGSTQIADAAQSMSQGATESAASLEQISASATEIGQQAKSNAETASHANQLAATAKTAAETGSQRMQALNSSMAAITESSNQIAKIIKAIDDIAFQTNILALNAAVEAARAGRHGKGFAVVAEEVRNLAARSAKAARETAALIEGSKTRVDDGNRIAKETATALNEIVAGIIKVGDLVGEMAAASNEQAQGIAQISQGLGQIDQVTQQNTATAEQTAASAEELSGQADTLRDLIAQFKLKGTAGHTATATTPGRTRNTGSSGAAPPSPRKALPDSSPAPGNATAKQPREGGWDNMAGRPPPAKPVSNEDIISLEDKEFGRY